MFRGSVKNASRGNTGEDKRPAEHDIKEQIHRTVSEATASCI